jgi:hypothetical protein
MAGDAGGPSEQPHHARLKPMVTQLQYTDETTLLISTHAALDD